MKAMLYTYQASRDQLRRRMLALRTHLRSLSPDTPEAAQLERRRRTLVAEIYEQEQIIRQIDAYLQETGQADHDQKGGVC